LGHLLGIHALVDHTRDLDITAQGQPSDPIGRLTALLFEKRELHIEKEEKLLDPGLEQFGGDKMPELVQNDQNGQAEYKEDDFYNYGTHRVISNLKTDKSTLLNSGIKNIGPF
jgi:hypothetical protein